MYRLEWRLVAGGEIGSVALPRALAEEQLVPRTLHRMIASPKCRAPIYGRSPLGGDRSWQTIKFTRQSIFSIPGKSAPAVWSVTQSWAVLMYLCEKTGKFLPADPVARVRMFQWMAEGAADYAASSPPWLFRSSGR
jgi:hypothetical protein